MNIAPNGSAMNVQPAGNGGNACPHCGAANPAGQKFCGSCGKPMVVGVTCPSCGKVNPVGQTFCGDCGTKLVKKCPSCGKHFHLNQEHWNYTIEQGRRKRELEEKRRSIRSQGCSEGRKAGYKTGFAEGKKVAVREFVDSLPSFFRWLVKLYIK